MNKTKANTFPPKCFIIGALSGLIVGTLAVLVFGMLNSTAVDGQKDVFKNYQIKIQKVFQAGSKEYTLAEKISGFQDKVAFVELYDFDLSGYLNTDMEYTQPLFSGLIAENGIPKEKRLDIRRKLL